MSNTLQANQRDFAWAKNIVIPRDGRRIKQLLDGSDFRSVSELMPTSAITPDFPTSGTRYGDMPFTNQPNADTFADFTLYNFSEDLRRSDFTRLFFAQARDNQLTVPLLQYESQRLIQWDAILKWIQFIKNATTGQYRHRYGVIPSQEIMTSCTIREYMSTIPWPRSSLNTTKPFPTEVSWYFDGTQGSFPRCLHAKLTLPGYDSGSVVLYKTGTTTPETTIGSQIFQPTNFTTWQDYFDEDVVTIQDSLFYRKSVELHAPNLPRLIFES